MITSLILLFIFLFFRIPIALSLFLSTLVSSYLIYDLPLHFILHRMISSLYSYPLSAIFLFLLGGELLVASNYPQKLAQLTSYLGKKIGLNLGCITVLMAFFLSGLTGAAVAEAGALASVFYPALTQKGYSKNFAASLIAAASTLGPIVPPSIPLIIYGVIAQVSISELFKYSLFPGIVTAFFLFFYVYRYEKKTNFKKITLNNFKATPLNLTKEIFLYLLFPLSIISLLLIGILTVTETSFGFFLVGFYFFKKDKNNRRLSDIFIKSVTNSAQILFILSTASAFSYILTIDNNLYTFLKSSFLTHSKWSFLLFSNLLLLIIGSFLETVAALYVFIPFLLPIGINLGISSVDLGILFVYNLVLGMLTPPFGIALFVSSTITKVKLTYLYKHIIPFLTIGLLILTLLNLIQLIYG